MMVMALKRDGLMAGNWNLYFPVSKNPEKVVIIIFQAMFNIDMPTTVNSFGIL